MDFFSDLFGRIAIAVAVAITTFILTKAPGWWVSYKAHRVNKCPYFMELHHVSLSVGDLKESIHFYQDVLNLSRLDRPDRFPFDGAWFALPKGKQLHLVVNGTDVKRNEPTDYKEHQAEADKAIGKKETGIFEYDPEIKKGARVINHHFALRVNSLEHYHKLQVRTNEPGFRLKRSMGNFGGLEQIYITDPDGNIIEISFFEKDQLKSKPYDGR